MKEASNVVLRYISKPGAGLSGALTKSAVDFIKTCSKDSIEEQVEFIFFENLGLRGKIKAMTFHKGSDTEWTRYYSKYHDFAVEIDSYRQVYGDCKTVAGHIDELRFRRFIEPRLKEGCSEQLIQDCGWMCWGDRFVSVKPVEQKHETNLGNCVIVQPRDSWELRLIRKDKNNFRIFSERELDKLIETRIHENNTRCKRELAHCRKELDESIVSLQKLRLGHLAKLDENSDLIVKNSDLERENLQIKAAHQKECQSVANLLRTQDDLLAEIKRLDGQNLYRKDVIDRLSLRPQSYEEALEDFKNGKMDKVALTKADLDEVIKLEKGNIRSRMIRAESVADYLRAKLREANDEICMLHNAKLEALKQVRILRDEPGRQIAENEGLRIEVRSLKEELERLHERDTKMLEQKQSLANNLHNREGEIKDLKLELQRESKKLEHANKVILEAESKQDAAVEQISRALHISEKARDKAQAKLRNIKALLDNSK